MDSVTVTTTPPLQPIAQHNVTLTKTPPFHPLAQPAEENRLASIAWDVFSTICVPVGLYRLSTYLAGKYIVPLVALPSTWRKFPESCYPSDINSFRNGGRLQREHAYAQNVRIRTRDGLELDGCEIHYNSLEQIPREEQRWVICFNPNSHVYEVSEILEAMIYECQNLGINRLLVNYRGTGDSDPVNPNCFDDLVIDGISAVEYLLNSGVDRNKLFVEGLSKGGAVALHVAERVHLPCVVHNTYATSDGVIPFLTKGFTARKGKEKYNECFNAPLNAELTFYETVLYSLKDLIGSPIELSFRVTY